MQFFKIDKVSKYRGCINFILDLLTYLHMFSALKAPDWEYPLY